MPIFSEWWLAKEKFSLIDSFILSSFPGATFQGCNGLSVKYQVNNNGFGILGVIQTSLMFLGRNDKRTWSHK